MNTPIYTGQKFGELTVIEKVDGPGKPRHKCLCSCGKVVIVRDSSLKSGDTKSCGCLRDRLASERSTVYTDTDSKMLAKRLSRIKERCLNPNHHNYARYGGRGIKICEQWLSNTFNFIEWSKASGWSKDLTIDRIDPDGPYSPENCRWVGNLVQQRNKTNNHDIEINGVLKPVSEWAEIIGVDPKRLYDLTDDEIRQMIINLSQIREYEQTQINGVRIQNETSINDDHNAVHSVCSIYE